MKNRFEAITENQKIEIIFSLNGLLNKCCLLMQNIEQMI